MRLTRLLSSTAEIGINDIKEELSRPAVPTPRPPRADGATSSTDGDGALTGLADSMAAQRDGAAAAAIDPDIERKRAEAAAAAWGGAALAAQRPWRRLWLHLRPRRLRRRQRPRQPGSSRRGGKPRAVEAMSLDELEAELARRKAASAGGGQVPQQLSAED